MCTDVHCRGIRYIGDRMPNIRFWVICSIFIGSRHINVRAAPPEANGPNDRILGPNIVYFGRLAGDASQCTVVRSPHCRCPASPIGYQNISKSIARIQCIFDRIEPSTANGHTVRLVQQRPLARPHFAASSLPWHFTPCHTHPLSLCICAPQTCNKTLCST